MAKALPPPPQPSSLTTLRGKDTLPVQRGDGGARCRRQRLDVAPQEGRHTRQLEQASVALTGLPPQTTPGRGSTPAAEHPHADVAPA